LFFYSLGKSFEVTPMPMAAYLNVGDNDRISALRAVGAALGAPAANIPSQSASQGNQHQHKWLAGLFAFASLPVPLSVDYNSFTSMVNQLVTHANNFPVNTAAPVASATSLSVAAAGVASVTTGTWTNSPTSYTYQWLRAGVAIAGATTNSHALVAADVGASLTCQVTAVNAAGQTSVASNAIGPITA
jgi:hypothetical protein